MKRVVDLASRKQKPEMQAHLGARRFVIERDAPDVGAYLYVYEGEQCTHDYLQDSIENCKAFALEEFGVPLEAWIPGNQ